MKSPKLYFRDSGLLHALLGYPPIPGRSARIALDERIEALALRDLLGWRAIP